MLNIISFVYFSYLAVRLFAKRKLSGEYPFMALLMLYVGLLDICNTNSTVYTSGTAILISGLALKAVMIIVVNYKLYKAGGKTHRRRSGKVIPMRSRRTSNRRTHAA